MKRLLVLFCLTGFLAKDIARLSWEIWFKINQVEIIAEKCENKDNPMMHCNGNCYLSKQLKKLDQKEQEHNQKRNPFQDQHKLEYIVDHPVLTLLMFIPEQVEKPVVAFNVDLSNGIYTAFFHPPTIS